ncbi:hypothetical protein DFH07DRAFT_963179 [Mycena maculata]|uniref:Uncharacterized protein n=1 Tax=Mycena maculata TaxID=230809 RepID=A0AAD7IP73_9AGAR|nr:hypothetical protein DFH07DRAFT_963179 [Mycena maculata]
MFVAPGPSRSPFFSLHDLHLSDQRRGKIDIAHHKLYHPYRRYNIERIHRDEEAREKEAKKEGPTMLGKKPKDDDLEAMPAGGSLQPAVLPTTDGHINFFEDLEHVAVLTFQMIRVLPGLFSVYYLVDRRRRPAAGTTSAAHPPLPRIRDQLCVRSSSCLAPPPPLSPSLSGAS